MTRRTQGAIKGTKKLARRVYRELRDNKLSSYQQRYLEYCLHAYGVRITELYKYGKLVSHV